MALRKVARLIADEFSGSCALFFFSHAGGRVDAVVSAGEAPAVDALLEEFAKAPGGEVGARVLPVIRRGEAVIVTAETPEELETWVGPGARELVRRSDVTSFAAVPLVARGHVFGGLSLLRHGAAPRLTEPDRDALADLGGRIAGALETERLVAELHRELDAQADVRDALHEAQARFQAAFAHAPVGLSLFSVAPDRFGELIEVNHRLAEIFACEPADLIGVDPPALSHPDDREIGLAGMERLLNGEIQRHDIQKRFVRFDGAVIHARLAVTLVRRGDGTPLYGVCLIEDETEQRRIEEERRRLAAIVESSHDAVLGQDVDGTIVSWNAGAERLFGYAAADALGRHFSFFVPEADQRLVHEARARVLAGEELAEIESRRVRADGVEVTVGVTWSPIRDISGAITGCSSILRDLSERRRSEREVAERDARYRAIVETTNEGVWVLDPKGATIYVNERMAEMLGVPRHEMIGRNLLEFVPPERRAVSLKNLRETPGDGPRHVEREMLRADGRRVWMLVGITPLRDPRGEYTAIVGMATDITQRRLAEKSLEQRAAQQAAVAALGRQALEDPDVDALMSAAAEAIRRNLAADEIDFVERAAAGDVALWRSPDGSAPPRGRRIAPAVEAALVQRFPGGSGISVEIGTEIQRELCPGTDAMLVCAFANTPDRAGPSRLLLAGFAAPREFTQSEVAFVEAVGNVLTGTLKRLRIQEQLRAGAVTDELTGLANRSLFEQRLRHALTRATHEETMLAVILVDIDRFRDVNDTVGRAAADELLKAVAHRVHEGLSPADTVARLDGDEFALLTENIGGESEAVATAERLLARLRRPLLVDGRPTTLAASAGVALDDGRRTTVQHLIRDADIALHRAKERGGGRLEVFDEQMRHRVAERMRLEQDLRRALAEGHLRLYFEPTVSLTQRKVVGIEALVRWEHPDLGLVPPSAFLPVAETSGLSVELGRWVLREVVRQIGRWQALRDKRIPPVSFNVFGRDLADPGYPDDLRRALRRAGGAADSVALELTESDLETRSAGPSSVLQRLSETGVALLLDDFGTGPLAYLRQLSVAGVKIDAALVAGIVENERDRGILTAIVGMASALGLAASAKGVETPEQAIRLLDAGCHEMQGTLVAGPGPASAIEPLLEDPVQALSHIWRLVDAVAPTVHARPEAPRGRATRDTGQATLELGDAARALGVSPSTLRRWADGGRIRAVRTAGGHRRFPAAEVARLNRENGPVAAEVSVRTAAFPEAPLPLLGDAIDAAGDRLAVAAGRAVYEGDSTGWFRSAAGQAWVGQWLQAIGVAARTGAYTGAADASRALVAAAREGGAMLLERHLLVERFADLAVRSMQERGANRAELLDARRLFLRLRQLVLAETPEPLA